jgi:O-antigen/teichoic acid export membrane protein
MSLIKRNLGWLLLSQGATWITSIVVLLVVPRRLGDEAFGKLTFAFVYVGFFELIALFGTGTYLTKLLARDTESVGRYVVNTMVLKALLTSGLIVVALGLAGALGYSAEMILLIAAFCVTLFFNALTNVLIGGLQALQRMGRPALWDVVRAYVGTVLALIAVAHNGSVILYALAFGLASVIPFVANFVGLSSELRRHSGLDVSLWREVLAGGFPFFVLSALTVVYVTIDVPILRAFSSDETVGWYGLAYKWVSMPAFFAAVVCLAFFPALSVEGVKTAGSSFARLANRALYVVCLVSTPAAIGIAVIASDFLRLVYGDEFQQAAPIVQILAIHIPVIAIDTVLGTIVVAVDRQRQWVALSVAAAVCNPLLNLVAIPFAERTWQNGAIGAATVTVLTEVGIMIGALRLRPAGVLDRSTANLLLRVVAASLTIVPVVLALGPAPLLIKVVAGVAVYAIASLALGTISLREIRGVSAEFLNRQPVQTEVAP